ncbi:MAG: STAS domain-containing protein [Gammaproteobacteria bacterium]|jgi:anti-anti-sigma factor
MVKFAQKNDTLTFTFDKRMDSKNSLDAEKNINRIMHKQSPKKIIFDLRNVDYVASAFLRICITIIKKTGKDDFAIINTKPQIKKIFKISGLEEFFDIT